MILLFVFCEQNPQGELISGESNIIMYLIRNINNVQHSPHNHTSVNKKNGAPKIKHAI